MKLSSFTRLLPLLTGIILVITFGLMIESMNNERAAFNNMIELKQLGTDFQYASDYLTSMAKEHVITGDTYYKEEYFKEINETRTREKVLDRLRSMNVPELEYKYADDAKKASDKLSELEMLAFEYAESNNHENAKLLLFSNDYHLQKNDISSSITEFKRLLDERCTEEARNAKNQARLTCVIALLLMVAIVLLLLYTSRLLRAKITAISEMGFIASKISDGEFDADIQKYISTDEFGTLAKSLSKMNDNLTNLNTELNIILTAAGRGDFLQRGNTEKYRGEWMNIVSGLNTLLSTLYDKIIGSAPVAYLLIENNTVRDVNSYARDMLYAFKGLKISDVLTEHGRIAELYDTVSKENGTYVGIIKCRMRNGDIHRYHISANALSYDEGTETFVIWGIDVEDLENALEAAREADMIKSRFLINMSHELRTPMNAVIGLSQIAMIKQQTPDNMEAFRKIHASAKYLLSIINDIIDFSKIEAGGMTLIEEDFNLEQIISNALMVSSERIGDKFVEILVNMDANVPLELHGDKTRLWQILKNILENSAKYTEAGQIILNVVTDKYDHDTVELLFTISDTGVGMSREQLDKMLNPFEQFYDSSRNSNTGTGLGMPITDRIVTLMGGSLYIESQLGLGTTVFVKLPFACINKMSTLRHLFADSALKGRKALIVDLNPDVLMIANSLLTLAGADAFCAKQIPAGGIYDMVIIGRYDIDFTAVKKLKCDQKFLMLSPSASKNLNPEYKNLGFHDIIEKPFVPTAFVDRLSSAFKTDLRAVSDEYETFPGASVLVCEDNVINQDVAGSMLEIFGIKPVIASDGLGALNCLENQKFDLVLMDILMPNLDGHQTTQRIRASQKPYRSVPIVAMTANVMRSEIDKCITEGMNAHIGKPIDIDSLYAILKEYLPRRSIHCLGEHTQATEKYTIDNFFKLNYFDTAAALRRFGGNRDRYIKSLLKFAESIPNSHQPFETAVSDENYKNTALFVHTLKGISGNLGVSDVYSLSQSYDACMKNGSPEKELYDKMINALYDAKQLILSFLSDAHGTPGTMKRGSKEELIALLNRLKIAASSFVPLECENIITEIKKNKYDALDDSTIRNMEKIIGDYDFSSALALVEELLLKET